MTIGTKTVLYGSHCFLIHPWFVALAWWKLYGFPLDVRLWFAFFLHDIGYIGKNNIDGEDGERHPELGANVMTFLFGKKWGDFTLYHSRFYARNNNANFSKLCIADKYAIVITPTWFYIFLARLSGEIVEYRYLLEDANSKYNQQRHDVYKAGDTDYDWFNKLKIFMNKWVQENKYGAQKS